MRTQTSILLLGVCGAALLVGCATPRGKEAPSALDPVSGPPEEATSVFRAKPKTPQPTISDEQRADFEKAVIVFQKLKKNGSLKGGDCNEAAAAFRRVADQNPAMLIARHNEAAVYMECGRGAEATRIEEDLARKGYAPALAQLGYAAFQSGDASQAESYFTRAIAADPQIGSVSARINLAQVLAQRARSAGSQGERDRLAGQALNHLRAVLALDANNLQAYATMCYIYYDYPLPDAAILIGRQAIKRAEEIATGKFEDEVMAETVNRDKVAVKRSVKGNKKDEKEDGPKTAKEVSVQGTGWTAEMRKQIATVHNTMGLISLNKKSYKDAIPSFKKAVELNPELYEARLNLAAVSLRFRDYVTAEENFRAVVGALPRNYDAMIGLGVALRGNRKFDEAEKQYLAAQKLDPSRGDSYFNLGLLYQEYKGSEKPTLQKAQSYYRDYVSHATGPNAAKLRRDAEKRIKDIDELFVALQEAEKLQREADEIQRKAEEQQKKMEEEMKRQDEAAKKTGAPPPATPEAPAAPPANDKTTPPPAATTPPPATK